MKQFTNIVLLALMLIGNLACSQALPGSNEESSADLGITVAGNPPATTKRLVQGVLESDSIDHLSACESVGAVEIFDVEDNILQVDVQDDCSFEKEVVTGKLWGVRFLSGQSVVSTMMFINMAGLIQSDFYYTAAGDSPIDFGRIEFSDAVAVATYEPSYQNDQNANGVVDFFDPDDDGDGIFDHLESDCDENGIIDDYEIKEDVCLL